MHADGARIGWVRSPYRHGGGKAWTAQGPDGVTITIGAGIHRARGAAAIEVPITPPDRRTRPRPALLKMTTTTPVASIAMSEGVVVDVAQLEEALLTRAMGIVTGLAHIEPDPRAPDVDAEVLDAALAAATGLHQLLEFRRAGTTATTFAEQAEATAGLQSATEQLTKAAEAVTGLLELAEHAARAGAQDLN